MKTSGEEEVALLVALWSVKGFYNLTSPLLVGYTFEREYVTENFHPHLFLMSKCLCIPNIKVEFHSKLRLSLDVGFVLHLCRVKFN